MCGFPVHRILPESNPAKCKGAVYMSRNLFHIHQPVNGFLHFKQSWYIWFYGKLCIFTITQLHWQKELLSNYCRTIYCYFLTVCYFLATLCWYDWNMSNNILAIVDNLQCDLCNVISWKLSCFHTHTIPALILEWTLRSTDVTNSFDEIVWKQFSGWWSRLDC